MKTNKIGILIFILTAALTLTAARASRAQKTSQAETPEAQLAGGALTIDKTVIAGGGAVAQNQSLGAQTTAGQTIAGNTSTGGQFSLYSGFWTPDAFAPTSATVTIGGRVLTALGAGIRNARVTITFPSGETRTTVSSAFGYFRFGDVEIGATYVLTVSAKRFVFSQPTQILSVSEARDDVNFIAEES